MSRPSQVPPQFPTKAEARRTAKIEADAAYRKWLAAEARAVHTARYTEAVVPSMVTVCRECGAVVIHEVVHNQWHDSLTEAVELASSALQQNEVY